jgi:hypothetical protein
MNENIKKSWVPTIAWICGVLALAAFGIMFDVEIKPSSNVKQWGALSGQQPAPSLPAAGSAAENKLAPDSLKTAVLPAEGYTVPIKWGETGKKLVAAGAIDINKFQQNYAGEQYAELLTYLTENQEGGITVNEQNAYFWVNTLWALGLTQKSDVLDKGIMGTTYRQQLGNFASTGGWTLGAKEATKLYSSAVIVPLTAQQQELVTKVSENIYRPCCGNSTAFPDCNHGMAILGLLELMASQGAGEQEMYKASLAFNSYWFPQTYMEMAYYFETADNTPWKQVDARKALSVEFSSAAGARKLKEQVGTVPGAGAGGGGCGA